MWKDNDDLRDYSKNILKEFEETISDCAMEGADIGGDIGSIFGSAGEAAGRAMGGVIGAGIGVGKAVWNNTIGKVVGGCYITTAICEEFGKPDNCYELTTFRRFRDHWLKQQPDGEMLITRYYDTAPKIVDLINKQPNRTAIYQFINENYLSKCLLYIENGENEKCKNLYIEMMEYLYKEQEKWG